MQGSASSLLILPWTYLNSTSPILEGLGPGSSPVEASEDPLPEAVPCRRWRTVDGAYLEGSRAV
jgi:hypothetical protein